MHRLKIAIWGVFLIALAGCAGYHVKTVQAAAPTPSPVRFVYIAMADGAYASGQGALQQAFLQAFKARGVRGQAGSAVLTEQAARTLARRLKTGYVLYPVITRWEDHNTPYSTLRDRVSVSVKVFQAPSGRLADARELEGKGPFWTFKNTTPDIILPGLAQQYVELFLGGKR